MQRISQHKHCSWMIWQLMTIFLTTYFEIYLKLYRRKNWKSTLNWGLAWTSLFSKMAAWPISWNCLSHLFTRQVIQTRMYLLVCWQTRIFWSKIWICICNLNLDLSQPRCTFNKVYVKRYETVADHPGFSRGGRQPQIWARQPVILAISPNKTTWKQLQCEGERIPDIPYTLDRSVQ